MAKGMVWGFLTLMLGVVALALAHESGANGPSSQVQPSQGTSRPPDAQEVSADELATQAYQRWSAPIWCALLEDEQPRVRIIASLVAKRAYAPEDSLVCEGPTGPLAPVEVRAQALKDGWNDPAIVAMVYLADCHRRTRETGCDPSAVQQRFAELDPGNAFAYLLPLGERNLSAGAPETFTDAEKQQLNRAASASTYREYGFAGVYDTYRAFERKQADLEPLVSSLEAIPGVPPEYLADPNLGLTWSTFEVFAVLVARAIPSYAAVTRGCRAAEGSGDQATLDDCFAVANLMAQSDGNYTVANIGRAIRHSLAYPEYRGARGEAADPNRWRKTRYGLVQQCELQRGIPAMDSQLPGPMPQSHLAQFLEDFQAHGERVANQNASAREFEKYPDAFALDPARCGDLLALDEDTQRVLTEQWRTARFEDREEILHSLARAIERQAAEG